MRNIILPAKIINKIEESILSSVSIASINYNEYDAIIHDLKEFFNDSPTLEKLSDIGDGILSISYESESNDLAKLINLRTIVFYVVNAALYEPVIEPLNNLKFTCYKSTTNNTDKMEEAGLRFYTPDEKLGFHNDALFRDNAYSLPKYVSLTNLFIGYENPGSFHYVENSEWSEFSDLYKKYNSCEFQYRPTPIVHESHVLGEKERNTDTDKWKKIPVFWQEKEKKYCFINGECYEEEGKKIFSEIQDSIMNNQKRISIPQALNQIIIFRNDRGYHSRDIFEKQLVESGITRLYLRAVSREAVCIPQKKIM